ncbi:ABC transporter permease [Limnovirga soli]|uniref:FtsX-like permease family protein n=1 Tax=Limnovirga soli TaxID=2656915 RepID=A0A8J8FHX9_9BACT|nr:ABC transporter permease [Limnovirga soli]NNV56932.1 FtsX-like permease family protein [Limnovirga soli]
MFKNYFKIAWRNIIKSRFYSLVNIIGLAAGIAFTLIIVSYVWSELQVNRNLKNADNQYIIQSRWKNPNQGIELTSLGPLAKQLKERYPDLVANYYRWDGVTSNVSKGEKSFREGIQICDSTMLNMYGFTLLYGNAAKAFDGPYSVVITEDRAIKYFGKKDVLGQTLTIENFSGSKHDFIVTGVMKMPEKNSATFLTDDNNNQFYIASQNINYFGRIMEAWQNQYIVSYIELQKGINPAALDKPMQYLINQNAPPQIAANMKPFLVPLKEYYLSANNNLVKKMLYALSGIAFFILLMAVINFINLSVSRSATRMKEIGIRKVLGGLKQQLIAQFLIESVLLVFFATLLAIVIAVLANPIFSNVLGKKIPAITDFPLYFMAFPVILIIVVGVMAGIYPAFVLSSLKSVDSLKGKLNTIGEKVLLRKSLVALQFGTATVVFIGAIIISQQVNLFFNSDLGYNKDYIVSAQLPRDWSLNGVAKMETIRKQFAALPQVSNATLSFEVPDGNSSGSIALYKAGSDSTAAIASQLITTDEYYASTFNIPMAAGIFYSLPGAFTDSSKIVINQTQATALGWKNPQDAIGKQVVFQASGGFTCTIAGVTKDFHFGSMQKTIQPVTFIHVGVNRVFRSMSFKLKPGNISASMEALQKQWSILLPGTPFEYSFMDDTLAKLYSTELQLKKAAYTATVLSLIIVLLGVLGLIALSIQKRTKEIGIRKVLGSTVAGIIALFMKEFLLVILIAGAIACPLAYFIMHNWLQAYAYRINITAMPFIISIVLLALLTGVLISLQTIKAANANPVNSLRAE